MKLFRLALPLALATTLFTVLAGGASAASSVVGHVYVNDNTAGTNTIAAFDRHADGTLTPTAGSPFPTGGAGTGHGIGAQGALQQTSDGRYLLAVDAGSNQISVLRISHDGGLKTVGGGSVSSGGNEPLSIAVHDNLVYVANAGAGGSNYTGFTINPGGHLRALANSTVPLPDAASPGDVLFNSDGTKLVGTRVGSSQIDSFSVGSDGRLTAAAGSPFTAQGLGPFGSEFRPTDPTQLFVSNAHDGAGNGTVSAFSDATDGTLTSIGSSPYPDAQTAPCWVEISHDGNFLFAVNTASSSISRYAIAANGALNLLGSTPISGTHVGAFDARLSPDGTTLYVVEDGAAAVGAFAVNGGTLTELPSSPTALPTGTAGFGIVVT
ncbi:MAG: beta-propeller fold lactonase family protein [Actinobacteria bacterium]|nr:beta-propeller fold lactonase family protein [Actinomycetota bacterium]